MSEEKIEALDMLRLLSATDLMESWVNTSSLYSEACDVTRELLKQGATPALLATFRESRDRLGERCDEHQAEWNRRYRNG